MADDPITPDPTDPPPDPTPDPPADPPPADPPADDAPLGEAGIEALRRERENAKNAKAEAKRLADEIAALKAEQMTETERAIEAAKAEGRTEALGTISERLIRSEIRAAAAGKVDPEWIDDLPKLLPTDTFTVDDDGEVDTEAIRAAIAGLVEAKPSLKATPATGSADGGPRGGGIQQVTRAELQTMTPDAIEQARKDGRLEQLLKGTPS